MPFAEASCTLGLCPLPVLLRVIISTQVVHLEHRSVSTRGGEGLSLVYLEPLEEVEEVDMIESTEPLLGRVGGDITHQKLRASGVARTSSSCCCRKLFVKYL